MWFERNSEGNVRINEEKREVIQCSHSKICYTRKLHEGRERNKENVANESTVWSREPNRSNERHFIIQDKATNSPPKRKKLGLKITFPTLRQRRKQRKHCGPQHSQSQPTHQPLEISLQREDNDLEWNHQLHAQLLQRIQPRRNQKRQLVHEPYRQVRKLIRGTPSWLSTPCSKTQKYEVYWSIMQTGLKLQQINKIIWDSHRVLPRKMHQNAKLLSFSLPNHPRKTEQDSQQIEESSNKSIHFLILIN